MEGNYNRNKNLELKSKKQKNMNKEEITSKVCLQLCCFDVVYKQMHMGFILWFITAIFCICKAAIKISKIKRKFWNEMYGTYLCFNLIIYLEQKKSYLDKTNGNSILWI